MDWKSNHLLTELSRWLVLLIHLTCFFTELLRIRCERDLLNRLSGLVTSNSSAGDLQTTKTSYTIGKLPTLVCYDSIWTKHWVTDPMSTFKTNHNYSFQTSTVRVWLAELIEHRLSTSAAWVQILVSPSGMTEVIKSDSVFLLILWHIPISSTKSYRTFLSRMAHSITDSAPVQTVCTV